MPSPVPETKSPANGNPEKQEPSRKRKASPSAWKKGQSGNPKGPPRRTDTFAKVAREILDSTECKLSITHADGTVECFDMKSNKSFRHAVGVALIRKALAGDTMAAKEIIDRTDGKVTDHQDITSAGEKVAAMVVFTRPDNGKGPKSPAPPT